MDGLDRFPFPFDEVTTRAAGEILRQYKKISGKMNFPDLPFPDIGSAHIPYIGPQTHENFSDPILRTLIRSVYWSCLSILRESYPQTRDCIISFSLSKIRNLLAGVMTELKLEPLLDARGEIEFTSFLEGELIYDNCVPENHGQIPDMGKIHSERMRFLQEFLHVGEVERYEMILGGEEIIASYHHARHHLRESQTTRGSGSPGHQYITDFEKAVRYNPQIEEVLGKFELSSAEHALLSVTTPPEFQNLESDLFHAPYFDEEGNIGQEVEQEYRRFVLYRAYTRKMMIVFYTYRYLFYVMYLQHSNVPTLQLPQIEIERYQGYLSTLLYETTLLEEELGETPEVAKNTQTFSGLSVNDNDVIDLSIQCHNVWQRTQLQQSLDSSLSNLLRQLSDILGHFSQEALRITQDNKIPHRDKNMSIQRLRDVTHQNLLEVRDLLEEIDFDDALVDEVDRILHQAILLMSR